MRFTDGGIRVRAAVMVSMVLLGVSACGDEAEEQRSQAKTEAAEQMSADFSGQGEEALAERIEDTELTELTRVETPYLRDWEIFEVSTDDPEADHPPTDIAVATSEHGSEVLTGEPESFASVLNSDSGRISDAESAVLATEDYITLTATRVEDSFTVVLESTDDIDVLSIHEEEFADFEEEFGDEIEPPEAEQVNDEFVVTAYVQHNYEIQLWTVTVGPNGTLDDESEVIVDNVFDSEGSDS